MEEFLEYVLLVAANKLEYCQILALGICFWNKIVKRGQNWQGFIGFFGLENNGPEKDIRVKKLVETELEKLVLPVHNLQGPLKNPKVEGIEFYYFSK